MMPVCVRVCTCVCVCVCAHVCVAEFYYSEKGTEEATDIDIRRGQSDAFERFSLWYICSLHFILPSEVLLFLSYSQFAWQSSWSWTS